MVIEQGPPWCRASTNRHCLSEVHETSIGDGSNFGGFWSLFRVSITCPLKWCIVWYVFRIWTRLTPNEPIDDDDILLTPPVLAPHWILANIRLANRIDIVNSSLSYYNIHLAWDKFQIPVNNFSFTSGLHSLASSFSLSMYCRLLLIAIPSLVSRFKSVWSSDKLPTQIPWQERSQVQLHYSEFPSRASPFMMFVCRNYDGRNEEDHENIWYAYMPMGWIFKVNGFNNKFPRVRYPHYELVVQLPKNFCLGKLHTWSKIPWSKLIVAISYCEKIFRYFDFSVQNTNCQKRLPHSECSYDQRYCKVPKAHYYHGAWSWSTSTGQEQMNPKN